MGSAKEPSRTLFISGFPLDVKYREIYNLCRPFKGFESCSLNIKGKLPVAFCAFADQESALAAKIELTGRKFDPDSHIELRIEFARHNTHGTRKRTHTGNAESVTPGFSSNLRPDAYEDRYDKRYRSASSIPPYAPAPSPSSGRATFVVPSSAVPPRPSYRSLSPSSSSYRGGIQPITTLFVASLGTYTQESEVRDIFQGQPGFRKLRFNHDKSGQPVAFVDFQDVETSTLAMKNLQGHVLPSCDKGGIRIEYAKNAMGTVSSKASYGSPPSYAKGYGPNPYGPPVGYPSFSVDAGALSAFPGPAPGYGQPFDYPHYPYP